MCHAPLSHLEKLEEKYLKKTGQARYNGRYTGWITYAKEMYTVPKGYNGKIALFHVLASK